MAKVDYTQLAKYPHLSDRDSRIWDKFIKQNPGFFEKVEYDVKVGEGRDYSMFPESPVRKDMEYLSKKRIDVVGYKGNQIWVIEVKPKAGLTAAGQVMGLSFLMEKIAPATMLIIPAIITDEEIPDIKEICAAKGIFYTVVKK